MVLSPFHTSTSLILAVTLWGSVIVSFYRWGNRGWGIWELVQGHTVSRGQSWDSDPGLLAWRHFPSHLVLILTWPVMDRFVQSRSFMDRRVLSTALIPSPGDLPNLWIETRSTALQANSLPTGAFWKLTAKKSHWASQVALVVKNPPASAEDKRDAGSVPELGTFPGEGNGNPLQYSYLENPIDREVWSIGSQRVGYNWSNLECKKDERMETEKER